LFIKVPFKLKPKGGFMKSRIIPPLWSFNYFLVILYIIKMMLDKKLYTFY